MGLLRIQTEILRQRGHLFPWIPVALACGIALFFGLKFEPGLWMVVGVGAFGLLAALVSLRCGEALAPLFVLCALIAAGFCASALRTNMVKAPILEWRYYGPIEGRIAGIDRSSSDKTRITLDHVKLRDMSPEQTPKYVRISLHGDADLSVTPQIGLYVMTTGHLSPPAAPTEPHGFNFQRHAYFLQLGGVGYSRVPLVAWKTAEQGRDQALLKLRMRISDHVQSQLGGDVGGFAAAVTTGDRRGISQQALEDLRHTNVAHLLAISGLHMGLLTGFVFGLVRFCVAAIPYLALRYAPGRIAAGVALFAAWVYLMLSGGSISTERAFIMAAVAMTAIMLERRAFSLHSVAFAAIILLILRPEALMSPGFQMSFAATTALIVVFGWARDAKLRLPWPRLEPVIGVLASSFVAGLATAPVSAAHFNGFAHYGLIANLLSVPLMGFLIIPSAVLALALAPFGLEGIGLTLMGWGLEWILNVCAIVADWPGARSLVPQPPAQSLPLIALGALIVFLWQGHVKWAGMPIAVLGAAMWWGHQRPIILISGDANLAGIYTSEGRALSKPNARSFVARAWLENDGKTLDPQSAPSIWSDLRLPGFRGNIYELSRKRDAEAFQGCDVAGLVISNQSLSAAQLSGCLALDKELLQESGAVSILRRNETYRVQSARDVIGDRYWTQWDKTSKDTVDLALRQIEAQINNSE